MALRERRRTQNFPECRRACNACNDPDNLNRDLVTEDEYTEYAIAIAEQDITDFVSGEAPIPQRQRPTSRRRTS